MIDKFSFAEPHYLWLLIIIPFIFLISKVTAIYFAKFNNMQSFADKELIPHLINSKSQRVNKNFLIWSILWILTILTLSGPRYGHTKIQVYKEIKSLVILLDLSYSMNGEDVSPSRLKRAKQEIADILKEKKQDLEIGLIGFSAVPHIITPLTYDSKTIMQLLPFIDTKLVTLEGSNIKLAIEKAKKLLNNNSYNKSILILSDGGFDDIKYNIDSNISVSLMGFGSDIGSPVKDNKNQLLKRNGKVVIDKLQRKKMQKMVKNGGLYIDSTSLGNDTKIVLDVFSKDKDKSQKQEKELNYWNEIFYIPLIGVLLILITILLTNNLHYLFLIFIIIFISYQDLHANPFKNEQQQAQDSFLKKNYVDAIEKFDNSYQKGVAQYKAGKYEEAEKSFSIINNAKSFYNLGNSLFRQNKFEEAVSAYQKSLKHNPNDEDTKHNLKLAKERLKKEEKDNSNDKNNQQDSDKNNKEGNNNDSDKSNKNKNTSKNNKDNSQNNKDKSNEKDNQPNQNNGNNTRSDDKNLNKDNANKSEDKKKKSNEDSKSNKENNSTNQSSNKKKERNNSNNKLDGFVAKALAISTLLLSPPDKEMALDFLIVSILKVFNNFSNKINLSLIFASEISNIDIILSSTFISLNIEVS